LSIQESVEMGRGLQRAPRYSEQERSYAAALASFYIRYAVASLRVSSPHRAEILKHTARALAFLGRREEALETVRAALLESPADDALRAWSTAWQNDDWSTVAPVRGLIRFGETSP
jgi:hypothetical protein